MLQTIRATVSDRMIEKVTRLFNQSTSDIIPELFQNARRAGATLVEVTLMEAGTQLFVTIQDNGRGIADPSTILTFGASDWNETTLRSEDPAGMGFFSMAGRNIRISSKTAQCHEGWSARIGAGAWCGDQAVEIEPAACQPGTLIVLPILTAERTNIESVIRNAATYLPIDVTYEGRSMIREDFLHGAIHIEMWKGCRIGVYDHNLNHRSRINFHGHQVRAEDMPQIKFVEGRMFTAFVDMGPSNDIQLVLPARKEAVKNTAYADLHKACELAIFNAIAKEPFHRLSFRDWQKAASHNVRLPEAKAELTPWSPRTTLANAWRYEEREPIKDNAKLMVVMSPLMANCIDRVLIEQDNPYPFYELCDPFRGYAWYDKLPVIRDATFYIETGQGGFDLHQNEHSDDEICDASSCQVPAITLRLGQTAEAGNQSIIELPATFAAGLTDADFDDLDKLIWFWTEPASHDFAAILDTLERGAFWPSSCIEADSHETQEFEFRNALRSLLISTMQSPVDAARYDLERLLDLHRHLIPVGYRATVSMDSKAVHLEIEPVVGEP